MALAHAAKGSGAAAREESAKFETALADYRARVKRPDPADLALAELQRDFLVDRGPSSVPRNGIQYLSKEGYPYRIFEKAHPDLIKAASKLKPGDALESIAATLSSISRKKLVSMLKLCLSAEERKASVET